MESSSLPRFTVVVPTRNRPGQLAACLASLEAQDYPADRFEVVVVDDGSDPPVSDLVTSFDRIAIRVISNGHSGPGIARNAGVDAATGDCIAFTDDDCTASPGWLTAFAAALYEHPRALLGGPILNGLTDNIFAEASQTLVDYLYDWYNRVPGHARFLTSNNLAVSRQAFLEAGGFDPIFVRAAGEDRELSARWAHLGRPAYIVSDATVVHRHHMGLRGFLRQHVGYGRGALYYRIREAQHGHGRVRIEPPAFYFGMMMVPWRRSGPLRALGLSSLLAVSQVANALGYFREKLTREPGLPAPPDPREPERAAAVAGPKGESVE